MALNVGKANFLVIMIVGALLSTLSLILVVYQVLHNEKSKYEIMQVFALINTDDVKRVYDVCDAFIDRLDNNEEVNTLIEEAAAKGAPQH